MKNRLQLITILASAMAMTGFASAADLEQTSGDYVWSGAYLGVNAGAAWSNSDVEGRVSYDGLLDPIYEDELSEASLGFSNSSAVFSGGAMLGYNWQIYQLVLGLETDINYADFDQSATRDLGDAASDVFGTDVSAQHRLNFQSDWWGTIRGRVGYAFDNILVYGTGGVAYGRGEVSSDISASWDDPVDGPQSVAWRGSKSDTNWGWTVGAGAEVGWENFIFGVEYLYVDLGTYDWDYRDDFSDAVVYPAELTDLSASGHADYRFSVVRTTAKWKF